MAKCSRCGKQMGKADVCPACGYGPSKSVVNKGMDTVARATGTVVVTGIEVTEKVMKEAAPVVRTVWHESKKGLKKARDETLKVAKSLKEEGR